MSNPASVDWTPRYTLPQRISGDAGGDCVAAGFAYAMEMRNILQGGVPVKLSEMDLNYQQRVMDGQVGTNQMGSLFSTAADCARTAGVCHDELWPVTILDPTPAIPDPYQAMLAGINREPNAVAIADRANHRLTDGYTPPYLPPSDRTQFILQAQTAIAAGYPVCMGVPPAHGMCMWGYDATGFIGPDSRATSPGMAHIDYSNISSIEGYVVKAVVFSGAVPAPTPIPPPTGNTQMLIDNIKAAGNGLVLGSVTQAQIDAGKALWNQLVPDVASAPVPRVLVPPAASFTTTSGHVWKLGTAPVTQYGTPVLCDGVPFAGGQATLISGLGNEVKVQNGAGNWYLAGPGGWSTTTAP